MWDECANCRDKQREINFMQDQLDEIRKTVDHYYNKRDHWDWDNLIDDILAVLEK